LKINFKYTLPVVIGFFCFWSRSQTLLELPIIKASTQLFNGYIYVFGLSEQNKKTSLLIYKLNYQLNKTDSATIELGKNKAEDFLQLSSDTLHNFLNIYIQKKEKKLVQVFRFNKFFKSLVSIEDVDIARLNSISTFENEIFYHKSNVYTIKSVNDTSGRQFYLNKYILKSELKNFEYDLKWQFPFERKNINSAHIVYTDKFYVILYVNVMDGQKKGQWILKINDVTGTLVRGTRINDKVDNSFYTFGKMIIDSVSKQIYVQGQKFTEAEVNQAENKNNFAGKTSLGIYLASIDSAGEMLSRNEFKIPVVEAKGVVNKTPVSYILRTNKFSKNYEGNFFIETDLFKGISGQLCFNYCNSNTYKLLQTEEKLALEKNSAGANPLIEKYYVNNDKLDMNGKLCIDSLKDFEKLFYNPLTFNVKMAQRLDSTNNAVWLLKKSELKKSVENYSTLGPVKKIYQVTKILEANKAEDPALILLPKNQFIISRQSFADKFQLQIFNW